MQKPLVGKIRVEIECPYCGAVHDADVDMIIQDGSITNPQVMYCAKFDGSTGGCGSWFAWRVNLVVKVITAKVGQEIEATAITSSPSKSAGSAVLDATRIEPDWSVAPAWAHWWAVDKNGYAIWYGCGGDGFGGGVAPEPNEQLERWLGEGPARADFDRRIVLGAVDWRTTLHQRPLVRNEQGK